MPYNSDGLGPWDRQVTLDPQTHGPTWTNPYPAGLGHKFAGYIRVRFGVTDLGADPCHALPRCSWGEAWEEEKAMEGDGPHQEVGELDRDGSGPSQLPNRTGP